MTNASLFFGRCVSMAFLLVLTSARSLAGDLSVPLTLPQLDQLSASIPVGESAAEVNVGFIYSTAGKITLAPGSTVDGLPVTGRATIKVVKGALTYTVNITGATRPRTVVTFKGVVGSDVRATYAGPLGRAVVAQQPVTLSTSEASADANFLANVDNRGRITGTGSITAYQTAAATPARLTGKMTATKLSFSLKQSSRLISFSGTANGSDYVGTLRATVLPSREIIFPFTIPSSAFNPVETSASFRGVVLLSSNSAPAAAEGITVTVKSDLNNDGDFSAGEISTVTTDSAGRYATDLSVQEGRPVLLEVSQPGYAKYMNAYPNVAANSTVTKNATLQVLNRVTISGGNAESGDGKLIMTGLPTTISNLSARVFNPNTDTAQFPGEFADSDRNLLVSSVFAAIEAKDLAGDAVTDLGTNTVLSMEVPKDTWNTMGDLTSGNGQIDVPLYFYNEITGEWTRGSPNGWLETTNHIKIPESDLASVQNGTYPGRVYSVGPITHLSYWNCDWPIDTHACVQAIIVDELGAPVEGATVTVRGLTYTGSTSPKVTGADGSFCADIMRSEGAGEDVDRDGVLGETHQVQITARVGTNIYSFGPINSSAGQGTCESGGCANLGNLVLSATNRLTVTLCTITGRMTYSGTTLFGQSSALQAGDPIAGATVYAFDDEASDFSCLGTGACTLFATTAADGSFSLTVPVLASLTVYGYKFESLASFGNDYYFSTVTREGCPSGQITLAADYWSVRYIFVDLSGDNVESGAAAIVNDELSFSLGTSNQVYYFGSTSAVTQLPSATGPWLTVNLSRLVGTSVTAGGTATFVVTNLAPFSGTWSISGGGPSGTFIDANATALEQPLPGNPTSNSSQLSEGDAMVQIEARRRALHEVQGEGLPRILPPTRLTPAPAAP